MSTIEDRIVSLKFDNRQFEQGVKQTQASLKNLEKSLKMQGASRGLDDIGRAASRFSLGNMGAAVSDVAQKFSALKVMAVTALATITNQAVTAGQNLANSLTLKPIMEGFREYETNMNSVQTIMANTAHEGTNLKQVNAALDELNTYSDKTIYNFSEMARNIGTFTAAGVSLDTSTAAIKGIANLAAVSGSNSQQASTAMYQLSQALAAGKVSLMDWNSVVNAGMGGKVFQDALMETARVHGVAIDDMVKKEGGFRNTLQNGWLSSEILTETLSKFTGDLSEAQLKQMGYSKQQIAEIQKLGKMSQDAATKIKTASQLIGSLQEAAGSGWAKTWQILFGDFEEAKKLFTDINNVLSKMIGDSADARNKLLQGWKDNGGRQALIDGLANAFHALMAAIKPIKEAFREIFPPITVQQLVAMTEGFKNFTATLKMGADTSAKVKSVFKGIFSVLDIGRMIVVEAVKMFMDLFGVAAEGSGTILDTAASFGDFLTALRDTLKNSGGITNFFKTLGSILQVPIRLIKALASGFASAFSDFSTDGVIDSFKGLNGALKPVTDAVKRFAGQFSGLQGLFDGFGSFIGDTIRILSEAASKGLSAFVESFQNVDADTVFAGLNTALAGGVFVVIKRFVDKLKDIELPLSGVGDTIKGALDSVTGGFEQMQNTLKATTLLQIGAAILMVATSISILAKLKVEDIQKSMITITGIFAQLAAALYGLTFITNGKLAVQLPLVAGGLVILGAAVVVLANAVKMLADLDWQGLTKGLVGVGAILGGLILFTKFAAANKGGLAQGAGILLLGLGIKVLASAVKDFASMDWGAMLKGMVGLSAVLAALTVFAKANKGGLGLVAMGAALVLIATSMTILAGAVALFGSMDLGMLIKGLLGMAAALTVIGTALILIPPTTLATAAALVAVSVAMNLIATAMGLMGLMSWEAIAKSLIMLAGSLTILSVALNSMVGALPGAAALIVAAGALAIMVPPLIALGGMSWGNIAAGLVALAGALAIITAAGYLLTGAIPGLLGLGVAATLLGVAALAAGTGVLAFASGLAILAGLGKAAVDTIVNAIVGLLKVVPQIAVAIAKGMVAFVQTIAKYAPQIGSAFMKIMSSILDAIVKMMPKILDTFGKLVLGLLDWLNRNMPKFLTAGIDLMVNILNGIARNMSKLITAGTNVAVSFINGITANIGKVVDAGVRLVIATVNGIADAIRRHSGEMRAAGANLGWAIIDGMTGGISAGIKWVADAARNVAVTALNAAKSALGIHSPSKEFARLGAYSTQGFANGLTGGFPQVKKTLETMFKYTASASKATAANEKRAYANLKKARRSGNKASIRKAQAAYNQARTEHIKANAVHNMLLKNMAKQRNALMSLGKQYDAYSAKIANANKAYLDAVKTRDDFSKQTKDQYDKLPDITNETTYDSYKESLEKQISDTIAFSSKLQELKKRGLNDQLYKELLNQGTEALPFMQALLDRGQAGIAELNQLASRMDREATALGDTASKRLYQAAVDSARGLVVGLEKQQAAIAKQMDKIADGMVRSIKKKLGIKSPSRVFAEVGQYANKGLIQGLQAYSGQVADASAQVGTDAVSAMRKTITGLGSIVSEEISTDPTVRPVLDLTKIKEDASKISNLLGAQTVDVGSSYSSAADVSNRVEASRVNVGDIPGTVVNDSVQFVQNNYSPKALSPIELYRQTNNQLSVAKGALTK